jgi:hypothetical protein
MGNPVRSFVSGIIHSISFRFLGELSCLNDTMSPDFLNNRAQDKSQKQSQVSARISHLKRDKSPKPMIFRFTTMFTNTAGEMISFIQAQVCVQFRP